MDFIPYKSNETLENKFYQIPQELFVNSLYKDNLNSDSKIIYSLLLDRLSLSQKNHWVDDLGRVYLIYPREDIGKKLNLSGRTLEKENKKLYKMIDKFKVTLKKFIKWICHKFDFSSEDQIIRDFERETHNKFNIEKQLDINQFEKKEKYYER